MYLLIGIVHLLHIKKSTRKHEQRIFVYEFLCMNFMMCTPARYAYMGTHKEICTHAARHKNAGSVLSTRENGLLHGNKHRLPANTLSYECFGHTSALC